MPLDTGILTGEKTHNFTIQEVFLDHDDVDSFGVLEGQESKSSRSAGATVSHYSTLDDFAKLGKVVSQRFYRLLALLKIASCNESGHTVGCLPV